MSLQSTSTPLPAALLVYDQDDSVTAYTDALACAMEILAGTHGQPKAIYSARPDALTLIEQSQYIAGRCYALARAEAMTVPSEAFDWMQNQGVVGLAWAGIEDGQLVRPSDH